jgi:UDP-glucose 4-epimerase
MQNIVVTGANGLLGSHLVPLLAGKANVHILTRQVPAESPPGVTHHAIDLAGNPDYSGLPSRIDGVIYLAQSRRFREFPDAAAEVFEVNVTQVVKLLDHARRAGARSFVHASTGGVYGTSAAAFSEDAPVAAGGSLGFYLTSKLCAEAVVREFAPHMNVAILRPFFIYGAGQPRGMLVPRLIDNVRGGVPLTLQGQNGMRINPVHASDAARAFIAALDMVGSNVVNVAGPETLSLRQIGEIIGRRTGVEPKFLVTEGSAECDVIGSTEKMEAHLCAPAVRFADGVGDLL